MSEAAVIERPGTITCLDEISERLRATACESFLRMLPADDFFQL
jgi:hypothetical protein